MKKVIFLLATVLIGGMMFTGCKKDNPTPDPTPDPEPTTCIIEYQVSNTNGNLTLSPCFKLSMTYVDANGETVTEDNVTLPWSKKIEVTSPFHAKMEGKFSYDEAELPESDLVYGCRRGIGMYKNGALSITMDGIIGKYTKENFLNVMANHPDRLQFTAENDF